MASFPFFCKFGILTMSMCLVMKMNVRHLESSWHIVEAQYILVIIIIFYHSSHLHSVLMTELVPPFPTMIKSLQPFSLQNL